MMTMMENKMTTRSTDYAALLLRVSLGVMFLAHGLLKIMVFTPAGTVGYFASPGGVGNVYVHLSGCPPGCNICREMADDGADISFILIPKWLIWLKKI